MSSCDTTAKARNVQKSERAQNAEALRLAAPERTGGRRRGKRGGVAVPWTKGLAWQDGCSLGSASCWGEGDLGAPRLSPLAQVGPSSQRPSPR